MLIYPHIAYLIPHFKVEHQYRGDIQEQALSSLFGGAGTGVETDTPKNLAESMKAIGLGPASTPVPMSTPYGISNPIPTFLNYQRVDPNTQLTPYQMLRRARSLQN